MASAQKAYVESPIEGAKLRVFTFVPKPSHQIKEFPFVVRVRVAFSPKQISLEGGKSEMKGEGSRVINTESEARHPSAETTRSLI